MARSVDPRSFIAPVLYKYRFAAHAGAVLPDAAADRETSNSTNPGSVGSAASRSEWGISTEVPCWSPTSNV